MASADQHQQGAEDDRNEAGAHVGQRTHAIAEALGDDARADQDEQAGADAGLVEAANWFHRSTLKCKDTSANAGLPAPHPEDC